MQSLNIKLIFPYNWYQARMVKVYNEKGELITKVGYCEQQSVNIPENTESIILKLDYFKSEITIPKNEKELYLIIYLDFRDSFPVKYFDVLKRKSLTGVLVDKERFENFNLDFYEKAKNGMRKANPDVPNLYLGALISVFLIFSAIYQPSNNSTDIVIFIGLVSLISLFMIFLQKGKIMVFDYKSRMIATGLAFLLGTLLQPFIFYITGTLLIFSLVFLFNSIKRVVY